MTTATLSPIPTPSTPSSSPVPSASYRLLYRGALSLPDSHLVLDGITFCARIDTPLKNRHASHTTNESHHYNDTSLLRNPLALALESMRGRPTLRLMGMVQLSNVWTDESGDILMDVHPKAILTRMYFENVFCLGTYSEQVVRSVLSSAATTGKRKDEEIPEVLEMGIKVALGDTDGPETTYMIIFANLSANESRRSTQLVVARLTARPDPDPLVRLPRPDDPIPRKPSLFLFGSKILSAGTRELKRAGSSDHLGSGCTVKGLKRVASVGGGLASGASKKSKLDTKRFKVPDVPKITKGKGKARQMEDMDVFGLNVSNEEEHGDGEAERQNKNMIKKVALDTLMKARDSRRGIMVDRSHPEFKELFQSVYRGVSFALRARMRSADVDVVVVKRLIKRHVEMYVGGHGSTSTTIDSIEGSNR